VRKDLPKIKSEVKNERLKDEKTIAIKIVTSMNCHVIGGENEGDCI